MGFFGFIKGCPGRGANLGSFHFHLFSLSIAVPYTTLLLRPPSREGVSSLLDDHDQFSGWIDPDGSPPVQLASVLSGGEVELETFIFQLISPSEPRFQGLLGVDKCCFGHDLVCSFFLLIRLLAI